MKGSAAAASAAASRGRRQRVLPRLAMPPATSASPLGRLAKRAVTKLTYWQVAPIVHHVNELQRVVERAAEERCTTGEAPGS